MGAKGDKAAKMPVARELYTRQSRSIKQIAEILAVSETTVRIWKESDRKPGSQQDEWDRLRMQKRDNNTRLRDLFDRQLQYVEECEPGDVTAPMMDALGKLGALVERWDKFEKAVRVADEVATKVKKAGITPEVADEIRRSILGIGE
jgi:transposase